MSDPADPFRHHPRLRDQILPIEKSFFRGKTLDQIKAMIAGTGGDTSFLLTEDAREACRARTMQGRLERDLWVFAYGSLIWDPALHFSELRRGFSASVQRRFILKDIGGGRGTADAPGLMAALDRGDGCHGMVFRIDAALVPQESYFLWLRERIGAAYQPVFIPVETAQGQVEALTFMADHDSILIDGSLTHDQQVAYCATGTGFLGSSLEYVENIARNFAEIGIEDAGVTRLLSDARAYRAAMD